VTEARQPQPFNEAAAVAELERLADRILATRRQREQAVAEFDAFVRTFRHPSTELARTSPSPPVVSHPPPVVNHASTDVQAPVPTPPPPEAEAEAPAPAAGIFEAPISAREFRTRSVEAVHQRPPKALNRLSPGLRRALVAITLAAFLVMVAAWLVVRWWRSPLPTDSAPAAASVPTATVPTASVPTAGAPAPTPPPTASPTAGAAAPRALNIEVVTVRPVWIRVTIDGRQELARELPAEQRLPFSADRSISIRAGDAGAVRLTVNGRDLGPLGRNGQPTTRTLNAPRPTDR
jgi:hypothetical protein